LGGIIKDFFRMNGMNFSLKKVFEGITHYVRKTWDSRSSRSPQWGREVDNTVLAQFYFCEVDLESSQPKLSRKNKVLRTILKKIRKYEDLGNIKKGKEREGERERERVREREELW
jgi:hypothetical protein